MADEKETKPDLLKEERFELKEECPDEIEDGSTSTLLKGKRLRVCRTKSCLHTDRKLI